MNKNTEHAEGFIPVRELKWLFFDLNGYFASVEQQERPELRGRPIAIVPMMTDSTCAIAASYEAKAYGIKTGTKIYDAKKLCPDLICVLARHDVYVAYHHRIFAEVENHIPVTKVCSVDEGACMLWKGERTAEKATEIALQIKDGLRQVIGQYVRCSIGVAPNMFLAKTATDMQKPDGLIILPPDDYKERLFKMSLRDLCGIGHNLERRLHRANIRTVEQFWNISPKHARKIWGSVAGERFWYNLHGFDVPEQQTQKSVIGHSRILDPIHRPTDQAFCIAQQLAVKACSRLRRYELYARKFALSVRSVDGMRWADERSFSPMQDNFIVLKSLDEMWQRMMWETRRARLLKVSVLLHDLYERYEITLDLFETEQEKKAHSNSGLSSAMDSLNKRYGANTVSVGACPKTISGFVGTKIAFTRVPEQAEFSE